MVEYFQRLGMGFGADTNAHTSFKETVYMLELPKVEPKFITDGLRLFRDDLDGMLLRPEEIDREKGVPLAKSLAATPSNIARCLLATNSRCLTHYSQSLCRLAKRK